MKEFHSTTKLNKNLAFLALGLSLLLIFNCSKKDEGNGDDGDGDGIADATDADDDNDGLIDVHDLNMLDHVRYNLSGTSYKKEFGVAGNIEGAPDKETDNCKTKFDGAYLCGYELMRDLDFANADSYADGTVNKDWRPNNESPDDATNEGFDGIGKEDDEFNAIFEGNGYSISNLYSRKADEDNSVSMGLFRETTLAVIIRNLGVVDSNVYGGDSVYLVGSLVGYNRGDIVASHATGGNVDGGGGNYGEIGGLVGSNEGGSITASFATVNVHGGDGDDNVGGLVGDSSTYDDNHGKVIASYATGAVHGGAGNDKVGGLVGKNNTSEDIIASYATGDVYGGAGSDQVGGLAGSNQNNTTASYATGAIYGGAGNDDVGGLVGKNGGNILASYATGAVNGDAGNDKVGGLVGYDYGGNVMASYATGATDGGGESDNVGPLIGVKDNPYSVSVITVSYGFGNVANGTVNNIGAPPSGVTSARSLTLANAGSQWNRVSSNTLGAWDFGTADQPPVLRYADYDGPGKKYNCDQFPACGSLMPGQGR